MNELNSLNFADAAEKVILGLRTTDRRGNVRLSLTTSKIRNMLTMTNSLYNDLLKNPNDKLSSETLSSIQYLKMKFAYEAGRERDVENFVKKAEIMDHIKAIGDSREKALLFCRYMESLVAYHKYYGGKDR